MGKLNVIWVFLLMALAMWTAAATMEEDEKECADQLQNLASCIPYVSGSAKKPTKQCCDDTVKVRSNKPKCLCVLIKESTDPSLALPVNTSLALQMPSACNIDAKVSDCPTLLKLSPDSPDAKIFKETNTDPKSSETTTPTTTPPSSTSAASSGSSPSSDSSSPGSKAATNSNNGEKLKFYGSGLFFGLMFASVVFMST